jgi:hypothetical protein
MFYGRQKNFMKIFTDQSPESFLERKRGKQKQLSHLTLPDGIITDSEKEINNITKALFDLETAVDNSS